MADEIEISALSNQELLCELKKEGLPTGPVTSTTRKVLEKRLAKARGINKEVQICTSSVESESDDNVDSVKTRSESQERCEESPSLFYGVCCEFESPNLSAVFTDRSEALSAARKVKGSRFKPFPTREEAENFSRSFCKDSNVQPTIQTKPLDPVSNFKTPKIQELTSFRKLIEQDKQDEVLAAIRDNPKYLVASGDTPVILQEGFRYNALHVAAKGNMKEMCRLIIDALESDWFWKNFLQQEDNSANYCKRKQFLVDMYLNTPEKGACDTPLHFACKFGHVNIVEFLVAHPLTDRTCTNKFGETPEQVICSRCPKVTSGLKEKIKRLLQENCFVPVFGSEDDATPPKIGEPWSPDMSHGELKRQRNQFLRNPKQGSPVKSGITIRAYAGPMSPVEATDFHRVWKTPPLKSEERKKYANIRRGDGDRGLERIGRQLAHDRKIHWTEYWSFLGCFADLATPDGLRKLEQYLADKRCVEGSSRTTHHAGIQGPDPTRKAELPKTPESRKTNVIVSDDSFSFGEISKADAVSFERKDKVASSPPFMNDVKNAMPNNVRIHQPPRKSLHSVDKEDLEGCTVKGTLSYDLQPGNVPVKSQAVDASLQEKDPVLENKTFSLQFQKDLVTDSPEKITSRKIPPDDLLQHSPGATPDVSPTELFRDELFCKKALFQDYSDGKEQQQQQQTVNSAENTTPDQSQVLTKNAVSQCGLTLPSGERCVSDGERVFQSEISSARLVEPQESATTRHPNQNLQQSTLKASHADVIFSQNLPPGDTREKTSGNSTEELTEQLANLRVTEDRSCGDVSCFPKESLPLPHVLYKIFIQGSQPTKLDLDVLMAIGNVAIDPEKFPNIVCWKNLVTSYSNASRLSWPSPGSPRLRKQHSRWATMSC